MSGGFLSNMFNTHNNTHNILPASPANQPALQNEIDKTFQPKQGHFFRTLEYPVVDGEEVTGKIWMEAAYDEKGGFWTLWQKSIHKTDDLMTGETSYVMSNNIVFPKTDFVSAYDQMTTLEVAKKAMSVEPMKQKSAAKLGGDYYKQFAWREGLMMSRSGRLYTFSDAKIQAANYFNQEDLDAAKEFLERLKTEQFLPLPISYPAGDWAMRYDDDKRRTDERLNALYARYNDDKNNHDLAVQVVGQESAEVLYLHMQRGFEPKIFEGDNEKHFALLKAAIDRPDVNPISLLTEAGVSFYISHKGETPVELALEQRRYSHLYTMLSRDGAKLANYRDDEGNMPTKMAMELQDRQAFRMMYLEGLDYSYVDNEGCALIHRAFESGFVPGVYAWLDEGLSIDEPIKGTQFTGLSIARFKGDQPLIDLALKSGANKDAPDLPVKDAQQAEAAKPVPAAPSEFTIDLLTGPMTNKEIEMLAAAHIASGKNLNLLTAKNVSLLELCWKNQKSNPDLNRRALIPVLGKLGADPAALLDDGSTVLTRITSASTLDMDLLKAVAPYAVDVNAGDMQGNTLLHTLQMNASEAVSHSSNVMAVQKLFPALDLNRQNKDGLSNIGLAIRLNRSQTLKALPAAIHADWSQVTMAGWSMLDIAFTNAAAMQPVTGAPRADKITATSDAVKASVLDMIDRTARMGNADQKKSLSDAFARQRPDGQTLSQAVSSESVVPTVVARLKVSGMPSI